MLTRIVKLTFKSNKTKEFESIFKETQSYIESQEGCNSVILLKDTNNPNIYFTYSIWENENYLENYRNSDFFKAVWAKTKPLFSTKAEAWSTTKK